MSHKLWIKILLFIYDFSSSHDATKVSLVADIWRGNCSPFIWHQCDAKALVSPSTPKHWCRNRDHTISISFTNTNLGRQNDPPGIGVSSLCLLFEIQRLGFVNHRPEMFSIFKNIWRWFCLWSTNHPPLCLTTWHELQGITDLGGITNPSKSEQK